MSKKPGQGDAQKISLNLFKEFLKQGSAEEKKEDSLLKKASNLGKEHGQLFIQQLKERENDR